jgi:uncharacterized membrane protein YhaH (DUF805 family)
MTSNQLDKISDSSKPIEQYNPIDWFIKALRNYTNFSGRARRKEYWYFTLISSIFYIIAIIIDFSIFGHESFGYYLMCLIFIIPAVSASVRRLHDTGRSGWFALIWLIPIVNFIMLFLLANDTKQETNQWGEPAK